MESMKLTPRLEAAASFVPMGARLADVGTDHGKLPVSLLLAGNIRSAIGTDLRAGPLSHAGRNAREHGVPLTLRLAPGLEGLREDECDTVTIAGMGGETIAEILAGAPWTRKGNHLLVLQAMTMLPELRCWLAGNGYRTEAERLCREGSKFYVIQAVRGGAPAYTLQPLDAHAPKILFADPLAKAYFSALLRKQEAALLGMRAGKAVPPERLAAQEALVRGLRARLEELH